MIVVGRRSTHAVFTTTVAVPGAIPFPESAKFTRPGDAETEMESLMIAARFTPAILELTCAPSPGATSPSAATTKRSM